MILTQPVSKLLRFEIDLSKADNINDIPFTTIPKSWIGTAINKEGKQIIGVFCKYNVNALNSDNDEVIGYLRECISNIHDLGDRQSALPILTNFCHNAFVAVEMDFQEKFHNVNIFATKRPSFDKLGQAILTELVMNGFYN